MASVLDMSLDVLVKGQQNEKARHQISDNELLSLFKKAQQLSDDQKKTVKDVLSAFLLKANLAKQLAWLPTLKTECPFFPFEFFRWNNFKHLIKLPFRPGLKGHDQFITF